MASLYPRCYVASHGIISLHFHSSDRAGRRGIGAAARPVQHDARRFTEPVAAIDAMACDLAVCRLRADHGDAVCFGTLIVEWAKQKRVHLYRRCTRGQARRFAYPTNSWILVWSFSTRFTPVPAMTAPRPWAPENGGQNTICALPPMARWTRPMLQSAWFACIWPGRRRSIACSA